MTPDHEITDIPARAIRLLAMVRADGSVNMLDSRGALELAEFYLEQWEDQAALEWLEAGQTHRYQPNPRYAAALKAMGEARAAGRLP